MTCWLECPKCGAEAVESDEHDMFWDGQEATCPECQSTVIVSGDSENPAYTRYVCKHGVDDETPCKACDEEELASEGAQGKEG